MVFLMICTEAKQMTISVSDLLTWVCMYSCMPSQHPCLCQITRAAASEVMNAVAVTLSRRNCPGNSRAIVLRLTAAFPPAPSAPAQRYLSTLAGKVGGGAIFLGLSFPRFRGCTLGYRSNILNRRNFALFCQLLRLLSSQLSRTIPAKPG